MPNKKTKIAIDVMGGDYAPTEIIKGILSTTSNLPIDFTLIGNSKIIEKELKTISPSNIPEFSILSTNEQILETDSPLEAFRKKPNASIIKAMKLLKTKKVDGVISMGPTGATMATATLILGLIDGIQRPTVGGNFLGLTKNVVMDLGTNVDVKPEQLLNFAIIGSVFSKEYLNIEKPKIALLNVGSETTKGNRLAKEAFNLFKKTNLNFIGNVEGMDIVTSKADVIVCDGFVGNIILKFAAGLGIALSKLIEKQLSTTIPEKKLTKLIETIVDTTSYTKTIGGGPLFGVNGPVFIGHGSSKARNVIGAIQYTYDLINLKVVDKMTIELNKFRKSMGPI